MRLRLCCLNTKCKPSSLFNPNHTIPAPLRFTINHEDLILNCPHHCSRIRQCGPKRGSSSNSGRCVSRHTMDLNQSLTYLQRNTRHWTLVRQRRLPRRMLSCKPSTASRRNALHRQRRARSHAPFTYALSGVSRRCVEMGLGSRM